MKIQTLDIEAKEWFDKINGNSYFSALATINYQLQDQVYFLIPFQYGYGSQFEQAVISELNKLGLSSCQSIRELRESGVIIRSNKTDKCFKKDVLAWGK